MKLIFIFTYLILSSSLYSQISGEYSIVSIEAKKVIFNISIRYDKNQGVVIPPIKLNDHSILKNAKFLKMESLASLEDSVDEHYVYRYEISTEDLTGRIPKLTVKYIEVQKEKYFEISPLKIPSKSKEESNWFKIAGCVLLIACLLPFLKKRKALKSSPVTVDLYELWRTNQYELFLQNALVDDEFSMDRALLQECYDQVKYAGIELSIKQKSQIEKNFRTKKTQIKTVEKEREDQFLASVLED